MDDIAHEILTYNLFLIALFFYITEIRLLRTRRPCDPSALVPLRLGSFNGEIFRQKTTILFLHYYGK